MIFHVLSLFPEAFNGFLESSILGKAVSRGLIQINLINIRDFAKDKHLTCDDATYGGGPGMLMKPEPIADALKSISSAGKRVIYLTPAGRLYNQNYAQNLAKEQELVLLCGHYEGIDQRIIDNYVTDEISIGDYILSSGVTAAKVIIDSVSRLVDGVIKEESVCLESFNKGLLEYPQYTRPEQFEGTIVPEVLLSGHHAKILEWRFEQSLKKTLKYRPELIDIDKFTEKEQKFFKKWKEKEINDEFSKKDRSRSDER